MKKGAKKQRLLWASTSVKNPAYPDTLYVAPLIGPDTVSYFYGFITYLVCLMITVYSFKRDLFVQQASEEECDHFLKEIYLRAVLFIFLFSYAGFNHARSSSPSIY